LDVDGDRVGDIEAVVVGIDTVVMEDKDASAAERACDTGGSTIMVEPMEEQGQ